MEQPGMTGFREVDELGRPVAPETHGPAAEGQPHAGRGRGVNPFIAALWTLSLALMIAGTWVFTSSALNSMAMSGPAPVSFLVFTYAPQAVLAGLATALCLLFWHAFQWQRRRG